MKTEPSNRTAALAGLWTSLGVLPFAAWSGTGAFSSGLVENVAWLAVAAVFIIMPAVYFVVGREARAFGRNWVDDPAERAKYMAMLARMGIWIVTAAAAGSLLLLAQKNLG
ncbi:hypothetical protein HHL21_06805 [Massilia sp. RP-1-19]|uniref:Uncharacterized protein n=1 Tax=Massilia polaris TaxID=2728846 RepID=A0A848HQC2_9BURK|nr:hypothetical protein [Massilia polaris]NML60798.1 hypothetical protein [Massilia polaris]